MRAHRSLLLMLGLVPVCHCGARTTFDTGSSSSPPDATRVTAQEFIEAYPEAFCARYEGCCGRAGGSLSQCLGWQRKKVRESAQGADMVFDPQRAETCLAQLRSWTGDYDLCQLRSVDQFASCVYTFSREPDERHGGESCERDEQCAGSLEHPRCASDENTGRRYCRGDPWSDNKFAPLGPCRTDRPGVSALAYDCNAHSGRTCSVARDRCSYNHDVGGLCYQDDDCLWGLVCHGDTCQPPLGPGQACGQVSSASRCAPGLDCDGGTCAGVLPPDTHCPPSVLCARDQCVEGVCMALHSGMPHVCGLDDP